MIPPSSPFLGLAGGHLSHGYQTDTKKISATSIFFEVGALAPGCLATAPHLHRNRRSAFAASAADAAGKRGWACWRAGRQSASPMLDPWS